jgi:hypothetical protein
LKAIIDSAQYSEVTRTRNKEKKRKKYWRRGYLLEIL